MLDGARRADPAARADARLRQALAGLRRDAQTVDESERIAALDAAVAESRPRAETGRVCGGSRTTTRHEHRRLASRGRLARTDVQRAHRAIVGLVIASFLGFLAAIRRGSSSRCAPSSARPRS